MDVTGHLHHLLSPRLVEVRPEYSKPLSWASFQGLSTAGEGGGGEGKKLRFVRV